MSINDVRFGNHMSGDLERHNKRCVHHCVSKYDCIAESQIRGEKKAATRDPTA
jgi:hypothetical protein